MPYVPYKKHFYSLGIQVSFILMANQILKAAIYSKHCCNLSLMPSPNSLHSLQINGLTLFTLFCSTVKSKVFNIYDYNNNLIESRQKAVEQQDAVFGFFFNLVYIKQQCSIYKFGFNNMFYLLPGSVTLRITGIKKCQISTAIPPSLSRADEPSLLEADEPCNVLSTTSGLANNSSTSSAIKNKTSVSKSKSGEENKKAEL